MKDSPESEELEQSTRRWSWVGVILMGLFVLAFPVYRLYEPAQRADAREAQKSYLAVLGGEIFATDCASCHGDEGRGGLGPALGAREFLDTVTDEQLDRLISLGVPGSEMVGYSIDLGGPMTSEEIDAVTAYIRSLEQGAESNPGWRTPLADANLAARDLYTLACARCHGSDRSGVEDVAPDIGPGSFAMDESDEWLASRMRDGFKEMPRWSGVLTEGQIQMLVNYLRGRPDDWAPTTTTTTTIPGATTTSVPGDTTTTTAGDGGLLALGQRVFLELAGGVGCADCHGVDAAGTDKGPNILGASKFSISEAVRDVTEMQDVSLSGDELDAVYAYLKSLSE